MRRTEQELPLSYLRVEGFKLFKKRQEVSFSRLTLLAGANSSGKSSLMQPLLLFKQTLEVPFDPGPLFLNGPNVSFSDVKQLFWHAAGEPRSQQFVVEVGFHRELGLRTRFRRRKRRGRKEELELGSCTWILGQYEAELREDMGSGEIKSLIKASPRPYRITETLTQQVSIVRNRFFLQVQVGGVLPWPFLPWGFLQKTLFFIHVSGLRGNPRRTYPQTAIGETFPGLFQDYVASVIAQWHEKKDPRIDQLGEHLRTLGLTWKVEARPVDSSNVEIRVGRLPEGKRGGARDLVNIADVGFGVSQVMPVVVALLAAPPGTMVYLEQPEIHLHPRAQFRLADLLGEAVRRGVQVVVETHSELLLLGIQKLVASGTIPSSWVKLYWFQRDEKGAGKIFPGELREDGSFGEWPVDFSEVAMEAMRAYIQAAAHFSKASN